MNKFTYTLLSLLFFLPLSIMAQEELTIIENGESQNVTGMVITISDTEEYIDTATKLYLVKGTNTFMLGDVATDGTVNITDVTTLVSMVLDEIYSKIADVTEDNEVNIADVTTEVEINLSGGIGKTIVESYEVEDITNVWIKSSSATAVDQH